MEPAERRLQADIEGAVFQLGVATGKWDVVAESGLAWPFVAFWIGAQPRESAPDRFTVRLDMANYPIDPATGTFWDLGANTILESPRRPFGSGQTGKVFRIDWQGGQAFYHPYDRVAARSHADWPQQYPHWIWTDRHTVADLLTVLWVLLNGPEYEGLRGSR